MAIPTQPNIKLVNTNDYREGYSNSVQVRVNVWDFFLVFGTLQRPQQAKALMAILQQNIAGYESTFGEIKLDPRMMGQGQVQ